MAGEQHRCDISDKAWEKIRPYTIGEKETRGGGARDTRQLINIIYIRNGALKAVCARAAFMQNFGRSNETLEEISPRLEREARP